MFFVQYLDVGTNTLALVSLMSVALALELRIAGFLAMLYSAEEVLVRSIQISYSRLQGRGIDFGKPRHLLFHGREHCRTRIVIQGALFSFVDTFPQSSKIVVDEATASECTTDQALLFF